MNNFKCFDNINLLELEFLENASRKRVFSWVHAVSLDGFLELPKIMLVVRYSESSDDINDDDGNNNNDNDDDDDDDNNNNNNNRLKVSVLSIFTDCTTTFNNTL